MWGVMVMSSSVRVLLAILIGSLETGQLAEPGKAGEELDQLVLTSGWQHRCLARRER